MNIFRLSFVLLLICLMPLKGISQFGLGFGLNLDLYQRYVNPENNIIIGNSAGSAVANFSLGPKIWIGKPKFSFSLESQIGIAPLGLNASKNKGFGMATIPIIAQFNFNGNSGLQTEESIGFSVGGGIQYNRTELFGLKDEYKALGLIRKFFPTYIIQAGIGYGIGNSGSVFNFFTRYGFHPDSKARSLNIGIQFDINMIAFRKNLKNPNSAL